jgi:O-antigen/teichoic acid export membrane protein
MFESIKRLTRHSAVYGISTILGRAIGFLLLPIYTHFLPTEAFGVASLVFAYLGIMTIMYSLGIDSAFLRYYILAGSDREKRVIFNTGMGSILVTVAGLSLLGILFAEPLAARLLDAATYKNVMLLAAGILFFDAMAALPFLLLRAEERSTLFVALKMANAIVNVALTYFFIVRLGRGVAGIFEANLISSAFTFLTLLPVAAKRLGLTIRRTVYVELLKFGLPYLPSTLAVAVVDLIDRFILEQLTDLDTVGLYSAGYKLGTFMNLLLAAFRFAWHPFFLSTSKEPDAKSIFARVLTLLLLVCASCFLAISLFIDELVRFRLGSFTLFGPAYWNSTAVVPMVLLAYIFGGAYLIFIVGIHLEKKTSYLPFITGLGAIVKIAATYALVPLWGMAGAAWGTVAAYFAMTAALYVVAQRLYPIAYEWMRVVKLTAVTALIFAVGYWGGLPWWQKAGLLLLFPLLLLLVGFFERGELRRISAVFRKDRSRATPAGGELIDIESQGLRNSKNSH